MGKDYYKILGIEKSANDDEIKKAYRKKAMLHHPDRNKDDVDSAKRKFQDVSEAFEVLSDKNKREIYDQFGEEGLKGGGPPPGAGGGFSGFGGGGFPGGSSRTFHFSPSDPNDIFSQFFSGMGGSGFSMSSMDEDIPFRMGGGARSRGRRGMDGMGGGMPGGMFGGMGPGSAPTEPEVIERPLPVSLEDLYNGTTKRLKVTRKQNDGTGRLVQAENVLEVTVKPGWKAGTKIRFPKAGDELIPGQAQTIVFVVEEKPHPIYKRDGDDLSAELEINLVEAFASFTRELKTLDGRTLKVTSSPGEVIQPGQVKLFSREGMPNQRTGVKGNLRVKLNVNFPKSATREQVEGIKRLFG